MEPIAFLKPMTIQELYPYWHDTHEEFLLELERIEESRWDDKPCHLAGGTIRQLVLHLIETERFWIGHVAQGGPPPQISGTDYPTKQALIEGFQAAREATIRYLDMLKYESLRAVRTIPADPENNIPESNMPLSWVVWHVMEHEIYHWGQIVLRSLD